MATSATVTGTLPVVVKAQIDTPGQPIPPLPRVRTLEAVQEPVLLTPVPYYREEKLWES